MKSVFLPEKERRCEETHGFEIVWIWFPIFVWLILKLVQSFYPENFKQKRNECTFSGFLNSQCQK